MKQGTNFMLDVNIDYNLDEVKHIDFVFQQDKVRKIWQYPSAVATRDPQTDTIHLLWTYDDTFAFNAGKVLEMDTLIQLRNSKQNPQTEIVRFVMSPTLFTRDEIYEELG